MTFVHGYATFAIGRYTAGVKSHSVSVRIAIGCLLICAGCVTNERARLHSAYPLERASAAVALAEAGDAGAVQELVNLLEDGDTGVRMYSQLALSRLTGKTYGYNYYDDELTRAAATERWRAALRNGAVTVKPKSERP